MCVELGAFKINVFPLGIDVIDILNYRTNYLQCKCGKKAIANT